MGYLKVKNWEEFQHYKDRNPPWIKLHRTLLDDYEFSRLQDASKAHLILIWLFASQKNGVVPDDPAFLKRKLGLEKEPNLKLLIDQGLLIPEQNASNVLADCKQLAPRDREETDTDKKNGRKRPVCLPDGFGLSARVKDWASLKGFSNLEAHLEHFVGWAKATGKTYTDWDQALMNAIRDDWAKARTQQVGEVI
jgi:hypothetical protein